MKWLAPLCALVGVFASVFAIFYAFRALNSAQAAIRAAVEALDACIETIARSDTSTGVCCCGDNVEQHGWGSGHSPVDEGDYVAERVIERARQARDELDRLP